MLFSFQGILCQGVLSLLVSPSDGWDHSDHRTAMTQCVNVVEQSLEQEVDPLLSLSIAWTESRFIYLRGWSSSAYGVMQVLPRYHCPDGKTERCNSAMAGVAYLKTRIERADEEYWLASCMYHDGNSCRSVDGRDYAHIVMLTYSHLNEYIFECGC
jgi:soluble lytic murein transglycosylase-like protein